MGIIRKWKVKREIKKILNSKDVEKVESINDFNKDENLENIILSIQDKGKRAQALQNAIHKIDDKEILKSIIPTLKDDDILKILEKRRFSSSCFSQRTPHRSRTFFRRHY